MQRWIVIAVIGALLVGLGGGFALWTYRQNRPMPVWVPLALNSEVPAEKREQLAAEIKAKLLEGTILVDAAKDVGLAGKLKLPTHEAAAAEARRQLFVKVGEAQTPAGNVPSINIGFESQRKTFGPMGEMAGRVMKDVWKMLGIKEPERPAF